MRSLNCWWTLEIARLRKLEASGSLAPFGPVDLPVGEILLGTDWYGSPVRLPLRALTGGILLVGNTGAGKTNLLKYLLPQIAAAGVAVWMTESHKAELRRLRHLIRTLIPMIILRPEDWRFNPLQCFLNDVSRYLVFIVDLLCGVLNLPPRARLVLNDLLYRAYERFGIFGGEARGWPTLYDLVEGLRQRQDINPAAKEALLDRLISLLLTLKPEQVAYHRGWNPLELLRYTIDFEMRGATDVQKQLVLGWLMGTVFQQKVEQGAANSSLSLLLALDDAQRFVSLGAQRQDSHAQAPVVELASVGRSPGIGLCFSVQTLFESSPPLIANLRNKFFGQLGSGMDYAAMASHLSLKPEQVDFASHRPPGIFIVKMADCGLGQPFLLRVPRVAELPPMTDAEAAASCEPLRRVPVESAHEFDHWEPFPSITPLTSPEPAPAGAPQVPDLGQSALAFLREIVSRPGQASSAYAKALSLNGNKAKGIRAELVARGFIREHNVALGTRGRTSIVLEPLPPAFAAVGQNSPPEAA